MLGCFVFSCMHASALDMSETFTLHTNRATANRWGKDDPLVCAKAIVAHVLA